MCPLLTACTAGKKKKVRRAGSGSPSSSGGAAVAMDEGDGEAAGVAAAVARAVEEEEVSCGCCAVSLVAGACNLLSRVKAFTEYLTGNWSPGEVSGSPASRLQGAG